MKFLLLTSLSFFAFNSMADETLESLKKSSLEHISKKISLLTDSKKCIGNAKDLKTYQSCKEDLHEGMEMGEHKKMMKGMKGY